MQTSGQASGQASGQTSGQASGQTSGQPSHWYGLGRAVDLSISVSSPKRLRNR